MPGENGTLIEYCDIIDDVVYRTYSYNGKTWEQENEKEHGFLSIPVVYHRRREGAYHTSVQGNIDETEKSISRLSEDKRTK